MTLPASGAITIQEAAAEFGISLPCVFPDDFWGKGGLPASGALVLPTDFYGVSNAVFTPDGGAISGTGDALITCTATAVWTYTGGGAGAFASIARGDSANLIAFGNYGGATRVWSVTGTVGTTVRNFTVTLLPGDGG